MNVLAVNMKRFAVVILMLLAVCLLSQAQDQNLSHAVRYQHEKRLYCNGDTLCVLTLDLEWPQRINNSELPVLQRFLTSYLLGEEASGMLTGLRRYLSRLGERLTAMPDDDAELFRRYIELNSQIFWNESNRYVSLYAFRQERDGDGHLIETKHRFFTYDLLNDRILSEADVFNHNMMWEDEEGTYRIPFEEELVKHSVFGGETDYVDISTMPREIALMGDAVLFDLGGAPKHASYNNLSFIKIEDLSYILSRAFKKYMKKPAPDNSEVISYSEDVVGPLDGDAVLYADTLPEFPGGKGRMLQYMAEHLKYPEFELSAHVEGKVVVSFVVNTDGSLSDFLVLNPVSPGLAREAVRVFTEMPRWKVGVLDGQPVRSRITVPVSFKCQSE